MKTCMKNLALYANPQNLKTMSRYVLVACAAVALSACSVLPEKPVRPAVFDFGVVPAPAVAPTTSTGPAAAVAMAAIDARGPLEDGAAIMYRLVYADGQQLRPYANARWSMPPAQLVDQRLRSLLSRNRPVLSEAEGLAHLRPNGQMARALRIELMEFDHVFSSATASKGVVHARATVAELTPDGERLLAQRQFNVQRDAPTPDAPGGVRALTAATDSLAQEIDQWLLTLR